MTVRVGQGLGGEADEALFFDADEGEQAGSGQAEVASAEEVAPCTPFARWRARARAQAIWLDLAGALALGIVALLLLLPYLQPHLPVLRGEIGFQPDEGTELYNSELLRRGWTLYTDAWDFKGPVGYAVFAFGYAFASATVKHGRITVMVVLAIWSALAFLCGRAITRRVWPGVILALFVPLGVWPNWPYAYNEYVAQCLLVGALLAALHARHRRVLWLVAGALASLAFWTSLSQGLPGMVSLGVAAVMLAWATGDDARRVAKNYAAGVAIPSLLVLLWLSATGALRAGLHAMFVFPFAKYQANNLTEYGLDQAWYVDAWTQRDAVRGLAVRLMTGATVHTPRIALFLALLIAGLLLHRVFFRHDANTVRAPKHLADLGRLVLPASLVAAALPPLFGVVRSDMCHLGFVQGTSSFAIAALAAPWPLPDKAWICWSGRIFRGALGLGLTFVVALLALFQWRNVHDEFPRVDLDSPTHFYGDVVAARTRPDDRVYILPAGGFSYLYAKRDNALSYASLEIGDYWSEQWKPSADQVVKNRPRLLLVEQRFFDQLVAYRPEIKAMYFGYDGNYILGERRPGVAFAERSSWDLSELDAGRVLKSEAVTLAHGGLPAQYTVTFPGGDVCLAALDEQRISLFRGGSTYVGEVSTDGKRMKGTIFSGDTRHHFVASRSD
jgi:hypothetical protein